MTGELKQGRTCGEVDNHKRGDGSKGSVHIPYTQGLLSTKISILVGQDSTQLRRMKINLKTLAYRLMREGDLKVKS